MLYLVSAPNTQAPDLPFVVASGSGLVWQTAQTTLANLVEQARNKVKYENVELNLLSGTGQVPAALKDKLVYSESGKSRLWVDTKPMAATRFTSLLAVVVQEIQSATGMTLGYVVAFPDGRVLKVAASDLIKYCEAAKAQGKYAVQNMQYVSANGTTTAHLKNYEGRTVPVFIQQRVAVNAEVNRVKQTTAPAQPTDAAAAGAQSANGVASMFSPEQLEVLGRGKKEGVDIRAYANPVYTAKQMDSIRNVLYHKKSPAQILDPRIPDDLMAFYSFELVQGADIRPYFNANYTTKQAVQVKLGVIRGLDVSKYADVSVSGDEMEQLRVRMDADMWSGISDTE